MNKIAQALSDFIKWVKWQWNTRHCKHRESRWYMHELGMGKGRYCLECKRCIETI